MGLYSVVPADVRGKSNSTMSHPSFDGPCAMTSANDQPPKLHLPTYYEWWDGEWVVDCACGFRSSGWNRRIQAEIVARHHAEPIVIPMVTSA